MIFLLWNSMTVFRSKSPLTSICSLSLTMRAARARASANRFSLAPARIACLQITLPSCRTDRYGLLLSTLKTTTTANELEILTMNNNLVINRC